MDLCLCIGLASMFDWVSVAGGTGSGFGSRIAEELRAEFPKMYLVSVP